MALKDIIGYLGIIYPFHIRKVGPILENLQMWAKLLLLNSGGGLGHKILYGLTF